MNRKLLIRFTIPSVIIGLFLFTACLLSIRYIHRLQTNLADILAQNVTSLQAVQELEIQVRQLRFHTFLHLLDPKAERLTQIEDDEKRFEAALDKAWDVSKTDEEKGLLRTIDGMYQKYKKEQEQLIADAHGRPLPEVYKIVDRHPVKQVIVPCQELLKINQDKMTASKDESQRVSQEGYIAMLFMGLAGPIGGLVVGFGVTRGLRRSIYQLSERVQDLAHHLNQDVGSVSVVADGDFDALEEKMQFHPVERRVFAHARHLPQPGNRVDPGQPAHLFPDGGPVSLVVDSLGHSFSRPVRPDRCRHLALHYRHGPQHSISVRRHLHGRHRGLEHGAAGGLRPAFADRGRFDPGASHRQGGVRASPARRDDRPGCFLRTAADGVRPGAGSEANTPLGRSVVGGLLAGLVTTLFVVPSLYSLVVTGAKIVDDDDDAIPGDDGPTNDPKIKPAHS